VCIAGVAGQELLKETHSGPTNRKNRKKTQQISVSVWKLPAIHIFAKRPNGRDLGLPIVLFAVATQN